MDISLINDGWLMKNQGKQLQFDAWSRAGTWRIIPGIVSDFSKRLSHLWLRFLTKLLIAWWPWWKWCWWLIVTMYIYIYYIIYILYDSTMTMTTKRMKFLQWLVPVLVFARIQDSTAKSRAQNPSELTSTRLLFPSETCQHVRWNPSNKIAIFQSHCFRYCTLWLFNIAMENHHF